MSSEVKRFVVDMQGCGEECALASDFDALHAEVEALRVALLEIASANPAERGIEWAKSYASDGLKGAGSELYARWLEAFREAEALRAENAALRAKQGERQEAVVYAVHAKGAQVDHHCPLVSPDMAADYLPGCATPLYTAPQPAPAQDVAQLPPLGESLRSILGRPNFACSGIAKHLRGMGYAIPNKAEEEQAATIHWLVNLYLKHGEDWATHANAALAAHDKQSGGEV